MKRHTTTGKYHVGGDERKLPSESAAFSLAQTLATKATDARRFGVFDNGTKIGRVERHADGVITTTRIVC
jgi:hypothetical protein